MGKEVQWKEKYIGTLCLPLLTWPLSDPLVQKLLVRPSILALCLQWFQRNSFDFQNPPIFPKIEARHPKYKIAMSAAEEIFSAVFRDPDFEVSVDISSLETQEPVFPAVLASLHSAEKFQPHTLTNPDSGEWPPEQTFRGKKVYTKGVFSSENSSASTSQKRGLACTKKLVFYGKRRKIHIHQRVFKVFVGDPSAQYWCIDFGLVCSACCPKMMPDISRTCCDNGSAAEPHETL